MGNTRVAAAPKAIARKVIATALAMGSSVASTASVLHAKMGLKTKGSARQTLAKGKGNKVEND